MINYSRHGISQSSPKVCHLDLDFQDTRESKEFKIPIKQAQSKPGLVMLKIYKAHNKWCTQVSDIPVALLCLNHYETRKSCMPVPLSAKKINVLPYIHTPDTVLYQIGIRQYVFKYYFGPCPEEIANDSNHMQRSLIVCQTK